MKRLLSITVPLVIGLLVGLWLAGGESDPQETESASYICPMHPTVVSERPGSCPVCGMDLVPARDAHSAQGERKILHWRAPMDPSFTSDKPGKSPMGMDLVPVYEDGSEGGTVLIDPVTQQNIGVKTVVAAVKPMKRAVRTVGRVDYDETRLTDVSAKVSGWVEHLFVDFTGQEVKAGQKLLNIYSPELVAAQEEFLSALTFSKRFSTTGSTDAVRGAYDLLESARKRLVYLDVQQEQIDRLATDLEAARVMAIHSPQEGVVVHKAVYDGGHIKAGEHLYRIADLSHVWVHADIYEYELPWVHVGQEAEVELSYQPGQIYRGEVTYIYPFLEPKTRTVKVRMAFDNADLALKPEMYANVRIRPMLAREALLVPTQAIIASGERSILVIALGDGRFRPQEVTLGVEANGETEVLKGIQEGDVIVTSAQFLIDSESNLKAALSAMTSESSSEPSEKMSGETMAPSPAMSHSH